jgi:hypothetical protein
MQHLVDMTDIRAACASEDNDSDVSVVVSIGSLRSMLDDLMKLRGRLGALRNACVQHELDATSVRKLAESFCERSRA